MLLWGGGVHIIASVGGGSKNVYTRHGRGSFKNFEFKKILTFKKFGLLYEISTFIKFGIFKNMATFKNFSQILTFQNFLTFQKILTFPQKNGLSTNFDLSPKIFDISEI